MIFEHAKSQFLDEIPKLIVRPQIDFWVCQKSICGRNTNINCEATNWFLGMPKVNLWTKYVGSYTSPARDRPKLIVRPQIDCWLGHKSISGRSELAEKYIFYETVNLQSRKTGGNKREPNATSKKRTIGSQCTVVGSTYLPICLQ